MSDKGADLKWLKKSLDKGIEARVRKSYKVAYAVNRMHKEGYEGLNWSKTDCQVVGIKVLEALVAGSGFWEEVEKETTKGKKVKALVMSSWFEQTWQKNAEKLLANAVSHPPMVIPPRDWVSPWEGGYYGASTLHSQLVRMHYSKNNKFMHDYKAKLEVTDMPIVYNAINTMQSTPFVINPFILQVLGDIIEMGGELGGVPRMNPIEMPAKLPEDTPEDVLKEHKKKLIGLYKNEEARKSKALRTLIAFETAKKFSKYDKVYFPWNIDYRGRCYPIPTALNPQGDDIQKSLLLFANKNPLPKEDSYRWLYIHASNLAGHDKISFNERVQWVEDNMTNIIASAEDPLGYRWWYDEAKNDYPITNVGEPIDDSDVVTLNTLREWDTHANDARRFAEEGKEALKVTQATLEETKRTMNEQLAVHNDVLNQTRDVLKNTEDVLGETHNVLNETQRVTEAKIAEIQSYVEKVDPENIVTRQLFDTLLQSSDIFTRKPTKSYVIGDITYSSSLKSWQRLECVAEGVSGNTVLDVSNPTVGQYVTDGTVTWLITDVRDGSLVGDVVLRHTLQAGYIKANGATVKASSYPRLLKYVLDNELTHDTDPSYYLYDEVEDTLRLPNFEGRFIEGFSSVETKEAGLPAITHTHTGTTNSSGTHSHTFPEVSPDSKYQSDGGFVGQSGRGHSSTVSSAGAHTHSVSINNNSAVNDIYGRSDTVQPPSVCLIPQIKY